MGALRHRKLMNLDKMLKLIAFLGRQNRQSPLAIVLKLKLAKNDIQYDFKI